MTASHDGDIEIMHEILGPKKGNRTVVEYKYNFKGTAWGDAATATSRPSTTMTNVDTLRQFITRYMYERLYEYGLENEFPYASILFDKVFTKTFNADEVPSGAEVENDDRFFRMCICCICITAKFGKGVVVSISDEINALLDRFTTTDIHDTWVHTVRDEMRIAFTDAGNFPIPDAHIRDGMVKNKVTPVMNLNAISQFHPELASVFTRAETYDAMSLHGRVICTVSTKVVDHMFGIDVTFNEHELRVWTNLKNVVSNPSNFYLPTALHPLCVQFTEHSLWKDLPST